MSEEDRVRWNERYAGDALAMGEGPNDLAAELEAALPREGRALEIACGEGQLAVWLARRGLDVDAIDIAASGLAKLRRSAAAAGVAARIRAIEHDLDNGLPPLPGGYALITCFHYYAPRLMPALRAMLAPGGALLLEVLVRSGDPEEDARAVRFRAARGEALSYAKGLTVQLWREGRIRDRMQAQLLARRALSSAAGIVRIPAG